MPFQWKSNKLFGFVFFPELGKLIIKSAWKSKFKNTQDVPEEKNKVWLALLDAKPLIKLEWWHRDRQTDPVERAREADSGTYGDLTDDVAVKGKGCTIQ